MFKEPPKVIKRERRSISDDNVELPQTLLCKAYYDITPQRESETDSKRPITPPFFQKDKESIVNTDLLLDDTYAIQSQEPDDYDSGLPYPLYLFYPSIATQTAGALEEKDERANVRPVSAVSEKSARKRSESSASSGDSSQESSENSVTNKPSVSEGKPSRRVARESSAVSLLRVSREIDSQTQTVSEVSLFSYESERKQLADGSKRGSDESTRLSPNDSLLRDAPREQEIASVSLNDTKSSDVSAVIVPELSQRGREAMMIEPDFSTMLGSVETEDPELSIWSFGVAAEQEEKRRNPTKKSIDGQLEPVAQPQEVEEEEEDKKEASKESSFEGLDERPTVTLTPSQEATAQKVLADLEK